MKMLKAMGIGLLLITGVTLAHADSAVIGSMWKQEGTTVLPADDVTELDVSGITCTGCGLVEGSDVTFGSGVFSTTLDEATGNEVALMLNYTTNKASSGNDTGFEINMWDAASPGTSLGIDFKVGGVSKFNVDNVGLLTTGTVLASTVKATGIIRTPEVQTTSIDQTLILQSRGHSNEDNSVEMATGTMTQSTGQFNAVAILPNYSSTGDASATDLSISRDETKGVGSGDQNYILATGGSGDFKVDTQGKTTTTGLAVAFSNISSENSPVAVAVSDYSFDCNATGGDVTFNLMSSSTVEGQGFEFTTTGSNKCFLNAIGSETISGFGNYSGLDIQWESVLIRSNGTNWTIKASY